VPTRGAFNYERQNGFSLLVNAIDLTKLNSDSKYAIDHLGNGSVDIFVGTSSDEIFVAGAGNDTLIGNGYFENIGAGRGI
jgi:hypothetical protein